MYPDYNYQVIHLLTHGVTLVEAFTVQANISAASAGMVSVDVAGDTDTPARCPCCGAVREAQGKDATCF